MRDIKTLEDFKANRDYAIMLVASRISKEIPDSFTDEESKDDIIYKLKVVNVDSVMDLKEKKQIEIKKGQTKSQKWRWIVEQELGEYENFMDFLIANQDKIFEMYRENQCTEKQ